MPINGLLILYTLACVFRLYLLKLKKIPEADIFPSGKTKYHLAINAASQSMVKEDPKLLLNRGT
jgi:hypothetical protein